MRESEQGMRKTPIVIALVLSILLVAVVLVGAKVVFQSASQQPVALSNIDSPEANSAQCQQLVESLGDFAGLEPAQIAEPIPPGARAWQKSSAQRITLRCGVHLPLQYSRFSVVSDYGSNTQWLKVVDTTPGSDLITWYSTDRSPAVAITANQGLLDSADLAELNESLDQLDLSAANPFALPLDEVPGEQVPGCADFAAQLPSTLGSDPTYHRSEDSKLEGLSAAWEAEGYEAVAVRCGVALPDSFTPGAGLIQVNGVSWFEDTLVGNGTTASIYYAVESNPPVAVLLPQGMGNAALVPVSTALGAN